MTYARQEAVFRSKASAATVGVTLRWDDKNLIRSLEKFDQITNGQRTLAAELKVYMDNHVIPVAQDQLRKKEPGTFNKTLPPTRQYKQSRSIYRRVADSLKSEVDPASGRLRIGSFPFPHGVAGQRQRMGTKRTIAQIVMRGMRPFVYSPSGKRAPRGRKPMKRLPPTVRSSIKFGLHKKSMGENPYGVYSSVPMSLKRKHPGFTGRQKFDFVAFMVEQVSGKNSPFMSDYMPKVIGYMAWLAGFEHPSMGQMSGAKGVMELGGKWRAFSEVSHAAKEWK